MNLCYAMMGRWDAGPRRLEAAKVLFDFIDECARCALVSHDPPRDRCDIRAIRKGELRCDNTSGELGGTMDLCYGTLGCWASARSEVLFDFIDECARCMCPDPLATTHGLGEISALPRPMLWDAGMLGRVG